MKKRVSRIISCVAACVVVAVIAAQLAAAYGGHVNPRHHAWPALATLALPYMSLATALLMLALLFFKRWWLAGALAVSLLASWPSLRNITPLNIVERKPAASNDTFKVLTFNVFGFGKNNQPGKPNVSMEYILEQSPDFVLLQEASLDTVNDYLNIPSIRPLRHAIDSLYPYHSKGYHDLVIMSKYPYKAVEDTLLRLGFGSVDDPKLHYFFYVKAFDVDYKGRQLRLINVHLQSIGLDSSDKALFLEMTELEGIESRRNIKRVKRTLLDKLTMAFRQRADETRVLRKVLDDSPRNVILCGDFNDTPSSWSYRTVRGNDMRDAWTDCGLGPTITYHYNRFYFKIDQILYRGDMRAINIRRDKRGNSDHYPQVATFEWTAK